MDLSTKIKDKALIFGNYFGPRSEKIIGGITFSRNRIVVASMLPDEKEKVNPKDSERGRNGCIFALSLPVCTLIRVILIRYDGFSEGIV